MELELEDVRIRTRGQVGDDRRDGVERNGVEATPEPEVAAERRL
jgi:hypothetical protein